MYVIPSYCEAQTRNAFNESQNLKLKQNKQGGVLCNYSAVY